MNPNGETPRFGGLIALLLVLNLGFSAYLYYQFILQSQMQGLPMGSVDTQAVESQPEVSLSGEATQGVVVNLTDSGLILEADLPDAQGKPQRVSMSLKLTPSTKLVGDIKKGRRVIVFLTPGSLAERKGEVLEMRDFPQI